MHTPPTAELLVRLQSHAGTARLADASASNTVLREEFLIR